MPKTPQRPGRLARTVPLALLAALSLLLPACGAKNEIGNLPEYPGAIVQGQTVDVQVVRNGTEISMTNTTARTLPAGRLWLNRWFSHDFPALGVGESRTYSLGDFLDRYGDEFKKGGFFATDRPDRLVQAQLETEGRIIGLIVVTASE